MKAFPTLNGSPFATSSLLPGWLKRGIRVLPDSLMFQAVAGLMLILAVISAAMFYGIDSFVSRQFDKLHGERIANQNRQIQQLIRDELTTYEALAQLVVSDSDLRQSAQYHLYLEGEAIPLREDLNRIAKAFHLDWLAVWETSGKLVATADQSQARLADGLSMGKQATLETGASLAWIDQKLWIVSSKPITIGGETVGWIQLARRANVWGKASLLSNEQLTLYPTGIASPKRASSIRIPVWSPNRDIRALDIVVDDPARAVLARTKGLIAWTLLASAILLAIAIAIYLHRLLTPVKRLTSAVGHLPEQIAKDQLSPLKTGGHGEVRQLVDAFNDMIVHLSRLRKMEAEMQAQEKLSAVGRVAMRVAHDLNNPMTVIKNTVHLLKPELYNKPELLAEIDLILHYCARCSSTIDNLLRFGKPVKLKIETIELGSCMLAYRERKFHFDNESKINLIIEPGGPYLTRGDRHQLEQMVDNILDNAFESNGNQMVDVRVGIEPGSRLFIQFIDYGKGFEKGEAARAFELFYTTKQTGTGLGLSNALAIAHAHGGDIRITDANKGGVTVWLNPSA